MPPRYAYWTILIDGAPTAFRAREREELLPTFNQLRRTNPDSVMKWFARGKLWDNPEQAQWAAEHLPLSQKSRGRDWRPGGHHKDPRARFAKPGPRHGTDRDSRKPFDRERQRPFDTQSGPPEHVRSNQPHARRERSTRPPGVPAGS